MPIPDADIASASREKVRGYLLNLHRYRSGHVLTVWIVEPDESPRLVTAYPDDDK